LELPGKFYIILKRYIKVMNTQYAYKTRFSLLERNYLMEQPGFTLAELLVVTIIVGILASLAFPLYRQNIKRAIATEGHALVGSIRTSERIYFAEHDTYTSNWSDISGNMDINNNKYFTTAPIFIASGTGSGATFTATVTGSADASGISISINQQGDITTGGI
jgi:type IV pilus assembly protein PilE